MSTIFRAVVMMSVFVGLPAAWVYYGPLPAGAQRVVDRVVDVAKYSLDWHPQASGELESKGAPRFQPADYGQVPIGAVELSPVSYQAAEDSILPTPGDDKDRVPFAELRQAEGKEMQDPNLTVLARELEPHFSLLKSLGVEEYSLTQWGNSGDMYRFRCEVALGNDGSLTRQFEAIHADPLATVRQVVGEVTSWQNARGGNALWR